MRTILMAILACALVAYGAAAKAPAHAHGAGDVHAVHFIAIDNHAHHHGQDHDHSAGDMSGADHRESGLHSHSAPQFNAADAPALRVAVSFVSRVAILNSPSLKPLRRERPPFKPPRLFL